MLEYYLQVIAKKSKQIQILVCYGAPHNVAVDSLTFTDTVHIKSLASNVIFLSYISCSQACHNVDV